MQERPDEGSSSDEELRGLALKRLKDKREFWQHLVTYVVVNAALVGIWALGDQGYFWPGWVLFGWGIGIVFHAWNTFYARPISDADVEREIRRLKGER